MVKGHNKKGQLRAIHAKDPYVRRIGINPSDLRENNPSRYNEHSSHINPSRMLRLIRKKIPKVPISKISHELLINTILTGLSTTIANPAPILIYQIYKKGMFSYKILKKIQKCNFINNIKSLSKMGVHRLTDKYIDAIVNETTLKAKETGYFREISQRTGMHESVSTLFFHSSMKKGLGEDADSLTDFVVEGML